MDDPEFEEPHTKKKKSAMSPSGRGKMLFAPPKSPGNMSKICSGYVPPTTKRCTTWAVHMFDQWGRSATQLDLLEKPFAKTLNYWLPWFIVDSRRSDRDPYQHIVHCQIYKLGSIGLPKIAIETAPTSWTEKNLLLKN